MLVLLVLCNYMVSKGKFESGFTVAEMVITMVVMAIFLTLLFQMYIASVGQQALVEKRSLASDVALTNLKKITSRGMVNVSPTTCDSTSNGSLNPNNRLENTGATGSLVSGSQVTYEALSSTILNGAAQEVRVIYPRGCDTTMPAMIVSTVCYKVKTSASGINCSSNTNMDSVTHAAYVN